MKRRRSSPWVALSAVALLLSSLASLSARAQDAAAPPVETPGPAAPAPDLAPAAPDPAASLAPLHGGPEPQTEPGPAGKGLGQLFETLPMPVALALIVGLSGLVATFCGAVAALWVTPMTMREIARLQAEVGREGVVAASQSAAAASDNARAAARNAEVAATNAQNTGIHAVARLRQDWINTLRQELSELHAVLMNWTPPATDAGEHPPEYVASVIQANVRLAKIRLLLNPAEVASQNLLKVIDRLNRGLPTAAKRLRLCRWLIVWSQIVLKTEWDRVRDELHGRSTPPPWRRDARR